jgi:4-phospho-D-threonate 3-dehydrogenase / 4-phospho-D-erythronate 3-dehydrogenase
MAHPLAHSQPCGTDASPAVLPAPELPLLGITMGDPAGIGPEIVIKALARPEPWQICRPLVIGDARTLRWASGVVRCDLPVRAVAIDDLSSVAPGAVHVLDRASVEPGRLQPGHVDAMTGRAAFDAIRTAIELALAERIDGVVTAPIHKEALNAAGHHFAGHTEIFAQLTGTRSYAMMLAEGKLRVVHVSTHVALRQACQAVKRDRVLKTIHLAASACRTLGIAQPRIGVTGLNPHASDGGLFGEEEATEIAPAIADARAAGLQVEGPFPADSLFPKAAAGAFDVVVAMYHDQGHIPVKMAGFRFDGESGAWTAVNGVNITLGLPIIRVSVDHGTACDQAGRGTASEQSLLCAIDYAARLARVRRSGT